MIWNFNFSFMKTNFFIQWWGTPYEKSSMFMNGGRSKSKVTPTKKSCKWTFSLWQPTTHSRILEKISCSFSRFVRNDCMLIKQKYPVIALHCKRRLELFERRSHHLYKFPYSFLIYILFVLTVFDSRYLTTSTRYIFSQSFTRCLMGILRNDCGIDVVGFVVVIGCGSGGS